MTEGLEKGTFISSVSDYEEEYYLSKNSWSAVTEDWKQRFEVGDVINDPAGDWDPSTAEAYIDQQVATITGDLAGETVARQNGDQSLQNQVDTLAAAVGTGGTVDQRIQAEATARTNADTGLSNRITPLEAAVGNGGSIDTRISNAVSAEQSRAQSVEATKADKATTLSGYGITDTYTKTEVNGLVDTPHQNYVTVLTYSALPSSGSADTIYRVSNYDGSVPQVDVTKYSEYAWNGSQYIFLCVKSQIDEVFDITVYHSNTTYSDLAAALGTNGDNIPSALRRGGMSIKYVQSSDNKYVQYRLMSDNFNTTSANWRSVDEFKILTSADNIDNIKVHGTYFAQTTNVQGNFPQGISEYSLLYVFGNDELFVSQIITSNFIKNNETSISNKAFFRTVNRSGIYQQWVEITDTNQQNGLLTASDNINQITKSGGYVIFANVIPQGLLPNGYDSTKVGNLYVNCPYHTSNLYMQILIQTTKCWIRNYSSTEWVDLTNDTSLCQRGVLYQGENIDTIKQMGSYILNTTLISGTLPNNISTYAVLQSVGEGNFWTQLITDNSNSKTWIRAIYLNNVKDWIEVTNKDVPEPVDPSQPFYGKKIIFFGDSITKGSEVGPNGEINNFPQFVSVRTGATILNVGVGGTQMANHVAAPNYNPFSFCNIIASIISGDWSTQESVVPIIGYSDTLSDLKSLDLAEYDYAVIAYGQNDRSNGVVVGNSDSVDNDEFYGAMNNSINALLTAYPNLHLIFIAPYNRMSAPSDKSIKPFVDAIINESEKWAMPVVNLYRISGINAKTVGTYLEDGLHPKLNSKYGYEFFGNLIAAQMLSFI